MFFTGSHLEKCLALMQLQMNESCILKIDRNVEYIYLCSSKVSIARNILLSDLKIIFTCYLPKYCFFADVGTSVVWHLFFVTFDKLVKKA